ALVGTHPAPYRECTDDRNRAAPVSAPYHTDRRMVAIAKREGRALHRAIFGVGGESYRPPSRGLICPQVENLCNIKDISKRINGISKYLQRLIKNPKTKVLTTPLRGGCCVSFRFHGKVGQQGITRILRREIP